MAQNSPSFSTVSGSAALDQLQDLIGKAKRAGAEAADALLVDATALSVAWRDGKLESLEQAESGDLGLRVLIGKRQAVVSTTDRGASALKELVERAVAMARAAPEDQFCGLAAPKDIAQEIPALIMADAYEVSAERLIDRAREAEAAALSVKGVAQCESADASASRSTIALAASNGFVGHYSRTGYGVSASAIAGEATGMETDYDYASTVFQTDLPDAASIGRSAGERAAKALNARKMPTCQVPVVFDPREAAGLLGSLAGAISGASVARGTSFLKDKIGQQLFPEAITIIDDPFRARGLRSKSFDGEGLRPQRRAVIDKGVLTTWLLDLRSARQLGLKSTGHASRGTGGLPSPAPSNLYMEAGLLSPAELIKDIKSGLYVTSLMGQGVNNVTGDYSRAAKGFWIENGVISFPVSEMTIAGNLKDMFRDLRAANDLVFRQGIDAPTLRIDNLTVAGV